MFSLGVQDQTKNTLLGTNISHQKSLLKMIFPFPQWDMLVPWRVVFRMIYYSLLPRGKVWSLDFLSFLPARDDFEMETPESKTASRVLDFLGFFFVSILRAH